MCRLLTPYTPATGWGSGMRYERQIADDLLPAIGYSSDKSKIKPRGSDSKKRSNRFRESFVKSWAEKARMRFRKFKMSDRQ